MITSLRISAQVGLLKGIDFCRVCEICDKIEMNFHIEGELKIKMRKRDKNKRVIELYLKLKLKKDSLTSITP